LGFTRAIAEAIQRARHEPAMTLHMRNATKDPISFPVLSARDSITFASMKEAKHVDSVITIQNFPSTGGFVTQANEITFIH
jgi:hypothetical protein